MGQHALLSASSAKRWLTCTPSARLEAAYPDQTSVYAEEGTLAHSLAENELRYCFGLTGLKAYCNKKDRIRENSLFSPEMTANLEIYKDVVFKNIISLEKPKILIEKKVNFSHIVPGGFGTADCVIYTEAELIIIDLKYGMGVPVSAEDNPQLKLYALGVMTDLNIKPMTVRTVICQPRLNSVSYAEYGFGKLSEWAEEIRPVAEQAYKGLGELVTGDHCRFCKHKLRCIKQMEEAFAMVDMPEPKDLTEEQLADILSKEDCITDYLKSVRDYARERAEKGGTIPGYKLVLSRTLRKYSDTASVVSALEKAECPENCFKSKEPISIGQMEKVLGKARFNEILGDLVIKPEGIPTLAPVSDKREEYMSETAQQVFSVEEMIGE